MNTWFHFAHQLKRNFHLLKLDVLVHFFLTKTDSVIVLPFHVKGYFYDGKEIWAKQKFALKVDSKGRCKLKMYRYTKTPEKTAQTGLKFCIRAKGMAWMFLLLPNLSSIEMWLPACQVQKNGLSRWFAALHSGVFISSFGQSIAKGSQSSS